MPETSGISCVGKDGASVPPLFRVACDDCAFEYEWVTLDGEKDRQEIENSINEFAEKIRALDGEIDFLTSKADGIDYSIAAVSGLLTGLVDSFFVGEVNWQEELKKASDKFDKAVMDKAGVDTSDYDSLSPEEKKKRLQKAQRILEKKYPLPSDSSHKKGSSGKDAASSDNLHHIDDLCHHPTIIGFLACVISVMFNTVVIVDRNGRISFRKCNASKAQIAWLWAAIVLTAFLQWILHLVKSKYKENKFKELPKPLRSLLTALASAPAAVELLIILNNWMGHLCSDMAGSSGSKGRGTGIPGILLSSLKELASIYPLNKIPGLHELIDSIFLNGFDARAEAAVMQIAGKQMLPVLLNEVLVRCCYFVRRLASEAKIHGKQWKEYDWKMVLPFKHRTIVRMLTVAHGTFVAVDTADAAIRTAISGQFVDVNSFLAKMALSINYVGIGRFVVAGFVDLGMGYRRSSKRSERMELYDKMFQVYNVKILMLEDGMWVAAKDAETANLMLLENTEKAIRFFCSTWEDNRTDIEEIGSMVPKINQHNPDLLPGLIKQL